MSFFYFSEVFLVLIMLNILDDALVLWGLGNQASSCGHCQCFGLVCVLEPGFADAFLLSYSGEQMFLGARGPAAQEPGRWWTHWGSRATSRGGLCCPL